MNYSSVNQSDYALNCFKMIHPFYQDQAGWNNLKFSIYSNLGAKQLDFDSQKVADNFFKNYLKLCSEIQDQDQQKKCLSSCLGSIQTWLNKQQETELLNMNILDVGDLLIPSLLTDQTQVFVDTERL